METQEPKSNDGTINQQDAVNALQKLFKFYTSNGFGMKLKSEIDLFMFELVIDNPGLFNVSIKNKISMMNKSEMTSLARVLKLTPAKLNNLIEKYELKKQEIIEDKELVEFLNESMKNHQTKEELDKGKYNLYVPNVIMRNEIEKRLSEFNFIPNYSFNKDILVIDIFALMLLISNEIDEQKLVEIITKSNLEKNKTNKKFMEEISKKTLKEKLISLSMNTAKLLIGDVAGDLIGLFKDSIYKSIGVK